MNYSIIKNLKTTFNKCILPKLKEAAKADSIFLPGVDLKKVSLERTPLVEGFQKQNYSQFISRIKNDSHKTTMATIFLRSQPMNKETYSKLSPEMLEIIRAQLTPDLTEDAELLVSIAKITKDLFNKKYGENQYTFISIGRSLSALANCLNFLGVKTKQIPLSGCGGRRTKTNETVNTIIEQEGFKEYNEFLEKTLEPDENKKRLFCDYAISGRTLEVFKSLLNHSKLKLGLESDEYICFNKLLINNFGNSKKPYYGLVMDFNKMLYRQCFDEYAEVRPLYFKNLNKLDSAINPNPKESMPNKLMKFCMLDMLNFENSQKA